MQLVILIIVNIVLATVFYLVISLKLEKSASEYREKKFRREMDEVIREFNNTAERNISLLEHKINVMKKLLRESGQLSSFDMTLGEKGDAGKDETGEDTSYLDHAPGEAEDTVHKGESEVQQKSFASMIASGLDSFKNMVNNVASTGKNPPKDEPVTRSELAGVQDDPISTTDNKGRSLDIKLEKDLSSLWQEMGEDNAATVDARELEEMFNGTGDKYGLVADLYKKGYPLDVLAKSSGIPLGELKLVLNLSTSL